MKLQDSFVMNITVFIVCMISRLLQSNNRQVGQHGKLKKIMEMMLTVFEARLA